MCIVSKDNFDSTYRFRNDEFKIGDIILIFDSTTVINISVSKKLNYRWTGSYRITESDSLKGIYRISELDGAVLRDTYADNRLKRFHAAVILDVSSRYKTSTPSNGEDDVVNFANTFQEEDLNVENLTFEEENKNNKIKDEDRIIKDEEQIKLRAT